MEVHHHSHTPRRKWTHYFWEFLMLFLAVFCGFLAENEREHFIEHKREKQFMKMMIEDLKHDTLEINFWHRRVFDTILKKMDSSLNILFLNKLTSSDVLEYYHQLPWLALAIDVVLEDRTSFQLKSSGNLRLIRNKIITDSLAAYWTRVDKLERTLQPTYEHDRQEVRTLIFSILNFANFSNKDSFGSLLPEATKELRLINDDFGLRVKLGNRLANQRKQLNTLFKSHFDNLKRQATSLINLIKREYNLE